MNIDGVTTGIVLDHIDAGKSLAIYNLLRLDKLDCSIAIIQNAKGSLVEDVDFVVIARKGVETLGYAEMEKNLLHVLKLSKIYQEGNGSEKETTVD